MSGNTAGRFGWSSAQKLKEEQAKIADRQKVYLDRFEKASFDEIMNDEELYAFAMAGGAAAFKDNCATCHGSGGSGAKGYPNLNDDDWLWGGSIEDIYQTIMYGIRSGHDEERVSAMPAFGKDELLTRDEIAAVTNYVMSLSGEAEDEAGLGQGRTIFQDNCASCHGENGQGGRDFGAPNLSDDIWLYGGDRETIYETVYNARAGVMPTWEARLDNNTIRQLAVYVHQLGGGEEETVNVEQQQPDAGTDGVDTNAEPVEQPVDAIPGAADVIDAVNDSIQETQE